MRAKEEFMKPIRVPELAPEQLAELESSTVLLATCG